MILYDYCRSSAAYRVRIALNLKQVDYEQVPVNLVAGEQRSLEHLKRNPQGLVPALQHGELIISQSLAICEYLDDAYPQSRPLVYGDPSDRARIRAMAQLIACDIHPVNNLRMLNYLIAELGVSEVQKMDWYRHWIYQGFDALEQQLAQWSGEYCYGDDVSLADLCLVPQVFNANRFGCVLEGYPQILRINDSLLSLPEVAAAHPDLQPGA